MRKIRLASLVLAITPALMACEDGDINDVEVTDTGVADTRIAQPDTGTAVNDTGTNTVDSAAADTEVTDSATADASDGATSDSGAVGDALDGSSADTKEAAPLGFCESKTGLAFCDDFDNADALMPGKTKWDFVEAATPPVLLLSTERAVSAPRSLLAAFPGEAAPGLRFAKTIPSATFTEAEWEFDLNIDALPPDVGFFLNDFQFSDDGGTDRFGFRFVVFSDGSGNFKEGRIEHNRPAIGMGDVLEPFLPTGAIVDKKWVHFKMTTKFDFAMSKVSFTLVLDGAATPVVNKTYDAPARSKITVARIAGLPFLFQKKAGHKIHWDNVTLRLK